MAGEEGGGFGEMLRGLFSGAVQLPVGLAKNALEIVKDPASSLNDRGEVSVTRLLFPEFRKEKMAERAAAAEIAKAEALTKNVALIKNVAELFNASPTDTQQAGLRQTLGGMGVDDTMLAPLAKGATETRKKGRQAYRAAGGSYEGSLVADTDAAQKVSDTAFTQQEQRKTTSQAQAGQRENMAFGIRERAAARRAEKAAEGGFTPESAQAFIQTQGQDPKFWEGLPDNLRSLGQAGGLNGGPAAVAFVDEYRKMKPAGGGAEGSVTAWQSKRALKSLNKSLEAGNVPDDFKDMANAALAEGNGKLAGEINSAILKRVAGAPGDTFKDPAFRKLREEQAAADEALRTAQGAMQAAVVPTADGSLGIDRSLFDPKYALAPDPNTVIGAWRLFRGEEAAQRKQALISAASLSKVARMNATEGKRGSDKDLQLINAYWYNGNEPSAEVFQAKASVIEPYLKRIAAFKRQQAENYANARRTGDVNALFVADDVANAFYASENAKLAQYLKGSVTAAENNPDNYPDVPLPPDQEAELAGSR